MTPTADGPEPGTITALLKEISRGEGAAFDELLPIVYDTLRDVARRQLGGDRAARPLCTTELVHEAYMKLAPQEPAAWEGRAHFFGVAAKAMRQVLVDHARMRGARKRGSGHAPLTLTDGKGRFHMEIDDMLALDQALDRLAERSERLRDVVELRFFAGLARRSLSPAQPARGPLPLAGRRQDPLTASAAVATAQR
jgi:RNA polymerase sigma factor (TIGR02999 family)